MRALKWAAYWRSNYWPIGIGNGDAYYPEQPEAKYHGKMELALPGAWPQKPFLVSTCLGVHQPRATSAA